MRLACRSRPMYRLADHVRACAVNEQVILLDLHRNKYLGIGGTARHAVLSATISDWPVHSSDAPMPTSGVAKLLAPLVEQGLLSSEPEPSKAEPTLLEPLASLPPELELEQTGIEWRALMGLWASSVVASYWIRHRTLASTVRLVTARKSGETPADAASSALRSAVAAYLNLRPLAITAHDKCLHDSLTLIRFLAARRLFPQWVIGVQTNPFAAHSWVQSGHVVLNDLHENVRRFRPILVV